MITINLLPPAIKESRRYAKKNKSLITALVAYVAIVAALYLGLGTLWFALKGANEGLAGDITSSEQKISKYGAIESEALTLSSRLDSVNKIFVSQPHFKKVYEELSYARPDGVVVLQVAFDIKKDSRIILQGSANSVTSVGLFRNALELSPLFEFVDIQTISKGDSGTAFSINMSLSKDAMK